MRRVLTALAAISIAASVLPVAAQAQSGRQRGGGGQQQASGQDEAPRRAIRIAPLSRRANAGPCPYVKILYDAARYVEFEGERAAIANVGYTGEIENLTSDCQYRGDEPIRLDMRVLFQFGRGPQAAGDQRTYRYWVAVTERNSAILAKEYFDIPVNFAGQRTAAVTEDRTITIPRAEITTNGSNFEVLVGFDVTPDMAEFNRSGSRFRVNAGTTAAPAAAAPTSE